MSRYIFWIVLKQWFFGCLRSVVYLRKLPLDSTHTNHNHQFTISSNVLEISVLIVFLSHHFPNSMLAKQINHLGWSSWSYHNLTAARFISLNHLGISENFGVELTSVIQWILVVSSRLPGSPFSSHSFSPFDVQFLENRHSELRHCWEGCRLASIVPKYRGTSEGSDNKLHWLVNFYNLTKNLRTMTEKDLWQPVFWAYFLEGSVSMFLRCSNWIWAKYINQKRTNITTKWWFMKRVLRISIHLGGF